MAPAQGAEGQNCRKRYGSRMNVHLETRSVFKV
jgi:hypothetical protein